jgi:hypothetical protein
MSKKKKIKNFFTLLGIWTLTFGVKSLKIPILKNDNSGWFCVRVVFGIFSDFTPNVSVQIPNNVKKLVIDGSTHSQVSLNAFNVDELTTLYRRQWFQLLLF